MCVGGLGGEGRGDKNLRVERAFGERKEKDALAYVHMDLRLESAMFFPTLSELN